MVTPLSWKIERVWTVGNLISIVSTFLSFLAIGGGIIGLYNNMKEIQVRQEFRLSYVEKQIEVLAALGTSVVKAQGQIENLEKAVVQSVDRAAEAVEQLTQIRIDIAQIRAVYESQTSPNYRGPDQR